MRYSIISIYISIIIFFPLIFLRLKWHISNLNKRILAFECKEINKSFDVLTRSELKTWDCQKCGASRPIYDSQVNYQVNGFKFIICNQCFDDINSWISNL